MKKHFIIFIIIAHNFFNYGQSIEKFSIDSGGASASAGGVNMLYTLGEVNVQEYSMPTLSVSEGFINSSFKLKIDPVVYLQGPILNPDTGGFMNDDLRSAGLIPTTSPYADNATCDASVFSVTGNDAIVDWVWVELRSSNDNTKLLNGKSGLLQRDGDVVAVDGISTLNMNAPPKDHFVVIKHRNHLGAMSQLPIVLAEDITTIVDFTNSLFNTFGLNAQAVLSTGDTALWTGDAGDNNAVTFSGANNDANTIKDYILADTANFLNFITFSSTGYLIEDVNLDGIARFSGTANDSNLIKDNVLNHPGNFLNFPTYTISTTVPPSN
ncbi:hemagglutinin protein [Winogradskyella sp. DF17]|uniref:Hemagglutinin protein n=1 Tax=Winogradskyella pelagia TaxID=2819984 RepID=A0ABS3SYE6_9FLAO|nr:hemagglutinin protein [Winogradskyella sp. DF17]MBO3115520.1 hemagglutinin protein [Winogradskyella sp. DF17]